MMTGWDMGAILRKEIRTKCADYRDHFTSLPTSTMKQILQNFSYFD